MEPKKVAVLIGTRPGIIKMSPLVHELRKRQVDHIVIHSGQHYSAEMDRNIMNDVGLEQPHHHIERPDHCISHAQQTAYMLTAIEDILLKEKPDILLVCGDANTNMAGALAARKIHVQVGHVEAGLRSFDWRMPEEHNRIIIDHISEYLFAPTYQAKEHLIRDGVKGEIFVVGNTIVDATLKYSKIAKQKSQSDVFKLTNGNPFVLFTLHREENVDNKNVITNLIEAVVEILAEYDLRIIFPVHPRTWKMFVQFGLDKTVLDRRNMKIIKPLGYLDFLAFLSQAKIVMTDSGGIQEESCILNVPCITLRESTERQETIKIGANYLAGTEKKKIAGVFNAVFKSAATKKKWKNPYGDGKTAKRIIDTCLYGCPGDELPIGECE